MRNLLILLTFLVSLGVSAQSENFAYDSLQNVNGYNLDKMKGQTLYYPSDQPIFRFLFYQEPEEKIYKEDKDAYFGKRGFTKEKYVLGKHFHIDDVIKIADSNYYYKTTIVESGKKVYISCNYLLSEDCPKMYVVGHLKKMEELYLNKTLYVKTELFGNSYDQYKAEKNGTISHYKGTDIDVFTCSSVRHMSITNKGLVMALYNGKYDLPLVLIDKYCTTKDTVDILVARVEHRKQIQTLLDTKYDFDLEYIQSVDIDSVVLFTAMFGKTLTIELLSRRANLEQEEHRIYKYGKKYVDIIYANKYRPFDWDEYDKNIEKYGESNAYHIAIHKVKVGWTKNMVLKSLGKPDDSNTTHTIRGTFDQWIYGEGVDRTYYHFDNDVLVSYSD